MAEKPGRLEVQYFDGSNWVALTSSSQSLVLDLEIEDTLYSPQTARFRVADLKDNGIFQDSSTNNVLKEFMNIRILDPDKYIVYFSGKIFRLAKKYQQPYGEILEVVCYDALYTLGNEYLDTDSDSVAASKAHTLISTWIGNHIPTALLSVANDSGDVDRFEPSAYNRANTAKVVKAGRSQISVLSAILQETLQDQLLTTKDRGYVYYVDPNFTSTATSHNPAGFFTYFARNRMPAAEASGGAATPSGNGLTLERPDGTTQTESGTKHLMMSELDISSSSREVVTDIIANYYHEETGKRVSKRFSIIHFTAHSGMNTNQYDDIGFDADVGTGGTDISNLVDSGGNVIGRIQYVSSLTAFPAFMILSDRSSHALVAGETLSADSHGSGASITLSSVDTIGSQFVYEPKAVWGVTKTTKANFDKESDANEIRTKLAGIFEGRQNVPDRLSFSTSQLPYYWVEGRATSSTTGSTLHDSAVDWETKGVRTGATFLKLSGTGGTVAAYGYVSSLTDAGVITCALNTGTWAVDDYYRWQVRVRAGHQVWVRCVPKGIDGEGQLVTRIKINQNMGSQTITSYETQGTAARSIPSDLAEMTSSAATHGATNVGSSAPVPIGDVAAKFEGVFTSGSLTSPDTKRHHTLTWTGGKLKLNKNLSIDSNEAAEYTISQNDTTNIHGEALTSGTEYTLYFHPDDDEAEFKIVATSSWNSADRTKLKIARILPVDPNTGSGAGKEAEIVFELQSTIILEGAASGEAGPSMKLGGDYFAVDGILAKHMLTVGSDDTSGVRFKFSTPANDASSSWFRGFTAYSDTDATGKWFDFSTSGKSLSFFDGGRGTASTAERTGHIHTKIDESGITFYNTSADTASNATTTAQYTGKLLTFYNGSGLGDANRMITLGVAGDGVDGKNGLIMWGIGDSPTGATPGLSFRNPANDEVAGFMYFSSASFGTHSDHMHWYNTSRALIIDSAVDTTLFGSGGTLSASTASGTPVRLLSGRHSNGEQDAIDSAGIEIKMFEASNLGSGTASPAYVGIYPATAMNGSDATHDTRINAPWVNIGYIPDIDSGYNVRPINAINSHYHYGGFSGTYSNPNYSWANDVDTGMYRTGTNSIGFSAGDGLRTSIGATGTFLHTISSQNNTAVHIHASGLLTKATSSRRYKDNIQDLDINTNKIYDLRPVSFDWKSGGTRDFGLIAEEVSDILPELVVYNEDSTPESVQYTSLSVLLLAELKTLREEVKDLKEKL
jgi:hypothetical protein